MSEKDGVVNYNTLTGGEEQNFDISSDLIRGHINTIILRSLYDGDKYGYDIISEIEKKSIREINEAKLDFFTRIIHELRTPLA